MKLEDMPKAFPGSTIGSTWATALLSLYCGGAFAVALARHLEWMSVGLTGLGLTMFAAMTAWNICVLHVERRAEAEYSQSEYSLTASRHSSKPARSP